MKPNIHYKIVTEGDKGVDALHDPNEKASVQCDKVQVEDSQRLQVLTKVH